ncbi:hypothetical protein D9M68_575610 [compost metagenome]
MTLAVVHRDLDVLHREAGQRPGGQRRAHALLHRGNELSGNHPAFHRIDEFEAGAARQRFDAQEHLAELAGAAGLLLVPRMAFGRVRGGLAVGDARRGGAHFQLVAAGQALQQVTQVQFAHATQHGLLGRAVVFQAHAGVLHQQALQHFRQALLVAAAAGLDCHALHRRGEFQRLEVDMVFVVGVVQHHVVLQLIDLAQRAEVAGDQLRHFLVLLALHAQQVTDLERLAPFAGEQLHLPSQRALVHAEHAHAADEGVDRHLEHVRQHMRLRVGGGTEVAGLAAVVGDMEQRRIALGGVGGQTGKHVQQFIHTGAATRGNETQRNQMPFAQRPLEGLM